MVLFPFAGLRVQARLAEKDSHSDPKKSLELDIFIFKPVVPLSSATVKARVTSAWVVYTSELLMTMEPVGAVASVGAGDGVGVGVGTVELGQPRMTIEKRIRARVIKTWRIFIKDSFTNQFL
jgi:hypothetical protein